MENVKLNAATNRRQFCYSATQTYSSPNWMNIICALRRNSELRFPDRSEGRQRNHGPTVNTVSHRPALSKHGENGSLGSPITEHGLADRMFPSLTTEWRHRFESACFASFPVHAGHPASHLYLGRHLSK